MAVNNPIHTGTVATRLEALAQGNPLTVLVIDDDELERALIADQLQFRGLKVAQATHGADALDLLRTLSPALILVDRQMPVMDGIAFTERVRAEGLTDTYVIMLTAKDSSFDYEQGYQAGVDDYLSKKGLDTELLARIYAGLNTYDLRRQLKEAQNALAQLKAATSRD